MGKFAVHPLETTTLYFLLSFLFFLDAALSRSPISGKDCSSSCGTVNIGSPFRLKGDPGYCGDRNFELVCDGSNTLLAFQSHNYSVLDISYKNFNIHVVDVGLTSGRCSRPLGSFSLLARRSNTHEQDDYFLGEYEFASFVSCRNRIDDVTYQHAPCLDENASFGYVVFGYQMKYLKPNCSFRAMTPYSSGGQEDAFKRLKEGFYFHWINEPKSISYCLREVIWETRSSIGVIFRHIFHIKRNIHNNDPILGYYDDDLSIGYAAFIMSTAELRFLYCVYESKGSVDLAIAVVLVSLIDLLVISLVCRFIFAPLVVLVFLAYQFAKTLVPIDTIEKFLRAQQSLTPTRYTYADIIMMTSHFKEKLGQGGFGSVFKGKLPGGHFVAVKVLNNSKYHGDDFINEVSTIGRIHHINVVKLVGFSSEGSNRSLVYEYMPNGSLDKHIFSSNNQPRFTYTELKTIALGVARGINYLHQGCDMQILHFDIKPHNILLDHNFTPKVSDFGLAKLYPRDYSLVSLSAARGTIGYIAPELISRSFGVISYKSDVYSFGMLLLEMAGGRRNVNPKAANTSQIYYPSWIYDQLNPSLMLDINNGVEISEAETKLCKVGLWCIQMKPSNRPSMSRVVEMLESNVEAIDMPPKPFISSPMQSSSARSSCLESSLSELSAITEQE